MYEEIFYPNKMSLIEAESLTGWKLKVATLHFGKTRRDCVRFGYGYTYMHNSYTGKKEIYLIADDKEIYKRPLSLHSETDWDDWGAIFAETGQSIADYCRDYVAEYFKVE